MGICTIGNILSSVKSVYRLVDFSIAIFSWCYTKHLAKALAEISCCLKSSRQGNLIDRHIGLFQQGCGMF